MQKKIVDYTNGKPKIKEEGIFKETEIGLTSMDWETVKLQEITIECKTGVPVKKQERVPGPYPYFGANGIIDYVNEYIFDGEYIIVAQDGSIGAIHYYNGKFWANNHVWVVRFDDKKVSSRFIYYVLKTIAWEMLATGSTRPKITKSILLPVQIPLPPLSEQQKIVKVLGAVQRAVEEQDRIIEAAKNLKKSLLQKLLIEGLGHTEFKKTEIGEVPGSWEVKPLIEIATLQRGKDLPKKKRVPGIYPVVGSNGILDYYNAYVVRGPGVTVGRSGSVGKLVYVEEPFWPLNTTLYVKDFHGNDPLFVYYLLHTIDFSRYATGVSVPTLNRNFVHPVLLPIPPLQEQQEIAHILSTADKKIEVEERKKATLKEFFKTLLHKLMTKEIRLKDVEV